MVIDVSVQGNDPLISASAAKRVRRRELGARRRAVSPAQRAMDAQALVAAVDILGLAGRVVCGYVPCGSEPGSLDFVNALARASSQLLLPLVTGASPLDWCAYTGPDSLEPAKFGLLEPSGERLGPEAIAQADVVLVPALAVDRRGVRLGRGGGHYDRSLPFARPGVRLIAVVRDEELVEALPAEEHDIRVGWVLTPGGLHHME
ncbi:MAG: 5-formyltetrahydrofolate cyclo-ligase [Nocardiaceae bacterium]|nr:5-formyltetrahydrofolate cyclo-ligase [Nocardiaceae bacterium]